MLPEHLIANYWVEVQMELTDRYQLNAREAVAAVRAYRRELESREFGDFIYHWNAEDTANTIGIGWQNGYYRADASKIPA